MKRRPFSLALVAPSGFATLSPNSKTRVVPALQLSPRGSWVGLWPLYTAFVAHGGIAHRYAEVCILPLPHYGWDRAPRPPPLQHRVPIRAAALDPLSRARHTGISWSGLLRGFFSLRQSGFRVWTLGPSFSASRRPQTSYEPLHVSMYRRRSAAADSGMPTTPDSFRLSQNPLGAYHLPQALTFVAPTPCGGVFR